MTTLTIHEKSFEACPDSECEKCLKITHEKPDEPEDDNDSGDEQLKKAEKFYQELKKNYENLKVS